MSTGWPLFRYRLTKWNRFSKWLHSGAILAPLFFCVGLKLGTLSGFLCYYLLKGPLLFHNRVFVSILAQ